MIVVEIPAALAERPEVVPVDRPYDLKCARCGASASLPLGARCDDHDPQPIVTLPSLVGQRVALAWRETCPTCLRLGIWPCEVYGDEGSRMVVGWTAEVAPEAVVPIVSNTDDPPIGPHVVVNPPHDGRARLRAHGRDATLDPADWSPGRYALVLRDVRPFDWDTLPEWPCPCRPFSGFAELDEVLT